MIRIPNASAQKELCQVIQDLSLFLSDQKDLGNHDISISEKSLSLLDSLGKQQAKPSITEKQRRKETQPAMVRKKSAGPQQAILDPSVFRCQGSTDSAVVLMDSLGTFYEGDSGELLIKMLGAIQLAPNKVFICTPVSAQMFAEEIFSDSMKIIFAFGENAAWTITGTKSPLAQIQGKPVRFCGIPAMPTYHPQQLLEDPALKRPVWEAMKQMTGRTA